MNKNQDNNLDYSKLEDRKIKEIEHSKVRREILRGFERIADTHSKSQVDNLEELVKDKEKYNYYFANMKYYSITKSSEEYKQNWLKKRLKKGLKVIDWACGNGENAIFAASCGANVTGIDISEEGINNCKKNAADAGLSDITDFYTMDGENMTFEDNYFDYGVEYGALHHVDLDAALSDLARVLKPNSEMICIEAIRHNPLIHNYRKRTPHLRTAWEVDHILGVESLKIMEKYFEKVKVRFFHLSAIGLVPLRKTFLFPILLPVFDFIDRLLLKPKFIGKFGWLMIVELSNPIK